MTKAYVDTSVLAAVVLDKPTASSVLKELRARDRLFSSNLLAAELRSVARRHGAPEEMLATSLESLNWVIPDRPLSKELDRVFRAGLVRGADVWRLACALFLSPDPRNTDFLTLDREQGEVARALGFRVAP